MKPKEQKNKTKVHDPIRAILGRYIIDYKHTTSDIFGEVHSISKRSKIGECWLRVACAMKPQTNQYEVYYEFSYSIVSMLHQSGIFPDKHLIYNALTYLKRPLDISLTDKQIMTLARKVELKFYLLDEIMRDKAKQIINYLKQTL